MQQPDQAAVIQQIKSMQPTPRRPRFKRQHDMAIKAEMIEISTVQQPRFLVRNHSEDAAIRVPDGTQRCIGLLIHPTPTIRPINHRFRRTR